VPYWQLTAAVLLTMLPVKDMDDRQREGAGDLFRRRIGRRRVLRRMEGQVTLPP
jgi:hypothetical protein